MPDTIFPIGSEWVLRPVTIVTVPKLDPCPKRFCVSFDLSHARFELWPDSLGQLPCLDLNICDEDNCIILNSVGSENVGPSSSGMASEGKWKRLENAICDKISTRYVMRLDVIDQVNEHVNTFFGDSCVVFEGV